MLRSVVLSLILLSFLDLSLTRSVKEGIVRIPVTNSEYTPTTVLALGQDSDQTYLRVLLSTASSEIWVPSSDCDWKYTWCRQHGHYNHREHKTSYSGRNFTAHFLEHEVRGRVSKNQMEVGTVVLYNTEFGEALTSDTDFSYSQHDGVLGLGPGRVSTTGSPLLTLLLERGLDDAVFSFSFNSREGGELVIGAVQHDKYTGNLVWSRVLSEDKWEIEAAGVSAGSHTLCNSDCVLEFNTEVEVIIGPEKQVEELYQLLDAKPIPGVFIRSVDCSRVDNFPDLTLTVKGEKLRIISQDYVERSNIGSSEMCFLMITSVEADLGRWVLGTLAHKSLYVAYDFGRHQIGLAEAAWAYA